MKYSNASTSDVKANVAHTSQLVCALLCKVPISYPFVDQNSFLVFSISILAVGQYYP